MNNKSILFILFLIALNLAAHFMPFERASLAPDDYAALVQYRSAEDRGLQPVFYEDRPLNIMLLDLQARWIGDNTSAALILLFLSATALLLAVYLLLLRLFSDEFSAFIGAVIFCLLPNKLETYHALIYLNINTCFFIYVSSIYLFFAYIDSGRKAYLASSVILYLCAIFWYEVGFFAPLVMIAYCVLRKKRAIAPILPFVIVSLFYAVYRLTGVFGLAAPEGASHAVSIAMIPFNIIDLLHHYFGRYLARGIIYGFYRFFSVESPWMTVNIISGLILSAVFYLMCRRGKLKEVRKGLLLFGLFFIVVFILPILLNDKGGVGGRHLVLPSVGISIAIVWFLEKLGPRWKTVFLALFASALIICEGNSWNQVVACRINGAVYGYIKTNKAILDRAENVVVDTRSFADNIPFTLKSRDFNVLNTFYGAQAFEEWGLRSMVRLVVSNKDKPVYVAKGPVIKEGNMLKFSISKYAGYRAEHPEAKEIPADLAEVINFDKVYEGGYFNGKREKR